ncbi:hypothetical protein XENOCAPTIV_003442, partial [Xenoophorus captivus]
NLFLGKRRDPTGNIILRCQFISSGGFSWLSLEVPSPQQLRKELVWLQQSLSVLDSPVVLCHNDLLCKNIIYNQREGFIVFIKTGSGYHSCSPHLKLKKQTQCGGHLHCRGFGEPGF